MMQRLLIGAADIHARPAAHRLEPFEHLDVTRRVSAFPRCGARWLGGRAPGFRQAREQIRFFACDAFFAHMARAEMRGYAALMWGPDRPKQRRINAKYRTCGY